MITMNNTRRLFLFGTLAMLLTLATISGCSDDAADSDGSGTDSTMGNASSDDSTVVNGSDSNDNGDGSGTDESNDDGNSDDNNGTTSDGVGDTNPVNDPVNDTGIASDGDIAVTSGTDTAHTADTDTTIASGTDTVAQPSTDSGWSDSATCYVTACQGHVYQCGDCIDNDGDGGIDSGDANCLGPCDNNESGYNMEIPGGNNHACAQDCYYDQDGGSGNDECKWDHRCDALQPEEITDCNYSKDVCPNCSCDGWYDAQPQNCLDFCGPLTPNGCDCFGCCQLDDTGDWRFLGSPGCAMDNIEACDQCTPVASCLNTCGRCEICLGKTTIPDDCFTGWDTDDSGGDDSDNTIDSSGDTDNTHTDTDDGGTTDTSDGGTTDTSDGGTTDTSDGGTTDTGNDNIDTDNYRCAPGIQPCGLEMDMPCPGGYYCITGCCQSMSFE